MTGASVSSGACFVALGDAGPVSIFAKFSSPPDYPKAGGAYAKLCGRCAVPMSVPMILTLC